MAIKRAKAMTTAVEITCPYCKEVIPEPYSGSLYWDVNEVNTPSILCPACDKRSLAPKV